MAVVPQGLSHFAQRRNVGERRLAPPTSAGRRAALPVLIEARHALEEAELLAERVQAALPAVAQQFSAAA